MQILQTKSAPHQQQDTGGMPREFRLGELRARMYHVAYRRASSGHIFPRQARRMRGSPAVKCSHRDSRGRRRSGAALEIIQSILLGVSLAAPLGPSSLAVIQSGLRRGFLRAFLTGVGVTLGDATYLLVVFFGLSNLMSIPVLRVILWALGAAILVYLGIRSIRTASEGVVQLDGATVSLGRNPVLLGYLINISNPVAIVWWVGVFGSLLGASASDARGLGALLSGATILIGILLWHSTISGLSHWGRRFLNARSAAIVSYAAGAALVLFGMRFLVRALQTLMT